MASGHAPARAKFQYSFCLYTDCKTLIKDMVLKKRRAFVQHVGAKPLLHKKVDNWFSHMAKTMFTRPNVSVLAPSGYFHKE